MAIDLAINLEVLPHLESCLHDSVRREEDQNATGRGLSNADDNLTKLPEHVHVVAILIAEVKWRARLALRQRRNLHLLLTDDVRVLKLDIKLDSHLSLKAVHRRQCAGREDDRARPETLDRLHFEGWVEAPEAELAVRDNLLARVGPLLQSHLVASLLLVMDIDEEVVDSHGLFGLCRALAQLLRLRALAVCRRSRERISRMQLHYKLQNVVPIRGRGFASCARTHRHDVLGDRIKDGLEIAHIVLQ